MPGTIPIQQGFGMYSIPAPVSTNLTAFTYPGASPNDGNGNTYDTYYKYQPAGGYKLLIYQSAGEGNIPAVAGWFDLSYNYAETDPTVWPQVGESFFIYHQNPSVTTWTTSFTVK